jgi:hypothetical protein
MPGSRVLSANRCACIRSGTSFFDKFLIAAFVSAFLIILSAIGAEASSNGPIGYWSFDEGVGATSKDLSGQENTAMLANGATWQVGKFGYAVSLNGVDQHVEIAHADSLNLAKEMTVVAWVQNRGLTDAGLASPEFHVIASKGWAADAGGSWTLAWDKKSNDISFCVRKGNDKGYQCVFVDYPLTQNEWHHVAGVVYDGKLSLYIDGLLAVTPTALGSTGLFNNREDLRIGAAAQVANKFVQGWDGLIDEVQLFNRALAESELKAMVQDTGSTQTLTTNSGTMSVSSAASSSSANRSTVATPVISPDGGTTAAAVTVTLKSSTPGSNIYYTTNGTTPTQASTLYRGPFTVAVSTWIKAKAFKNNSNPSAEAKAWFTIDNQQFDFSLSNSGNKNSQKGGSAQNQINAALLSGGTQPVDFSVSGLPSGANASFSNAQCGPACSSNLTVTTSAATPTGTFPLVVTGTGGGKSRTTSFNLTVTDVPFDYALSNLGNQSVVAGSPASNKIDATLVSGSAQAVTFTASGLPAGASASFAAPNCTPTCSSNLTINTTAGTTPAATSTVTVSATGGGLTRTTTFNLTVSAPTVATPTITPNGGSFNGSAQVTLATATSGASIRYTTDNSTPTASSTLYSAPFTLVNSATVKAAAFMNNYNPSGVASAAFTVTQPFDFALTNLGNQSVVAGSPASNKIDATLVSGSAQAVTFTASGLPAGASASFAAPNCTPTCSSNLTINTTAGITPAGTSAITVSAAGGGVTKTTTFNLTVSAPTVATPTITPNGGSFNGSAQVTLATATSGASIRYTTDNSTPTASSTLYSAPFTLVNSATVKAAAFMNNYNPSGIASAAFTVTPPFDFSLSVTNNGNSTVTAGSSIGFLATATLLSGTTQSVAFSASGLPAGTTAAFSSTSCSPTCSSTLTLSTTAGTTPAGTSTITVSAVGGGITRTVTFSLTVIVPTVATPTITPNGGSFNGPVSITMASATSGASIRYTTDGSTPTASSTLYSGTFTLSNSATVKAAAFKSNYNTSGVASAGFTIATSCSVGQFLAEYFNNTTLSGGPAFTTCVPSVNFNWGTAGPGNGINTDQFSARWTGNFSFSAGTYTFTATADDGIRLWVDGTLIIDQWKDQSATTYQATITFTAGTHAIKVEYYDNSGDAVAQLGWQAAPTPSHLTVSWQDMSNNEDGFAIERRLGSSGTYAQITTVAANNTSYYDSGVLSGSQYCYRVKAFTATASSAYSNEACQTAP